MDRPLMSPKAQRSLWLWGLVGIAFLMATGAAWLLYTRVTYTNDDFQCLKNIADSAQPICYYCPFQESFENTVEEFIGATFGVTSAPPDSTAGLRFRSWADVLDPSGLASFLPVRYSVSSGGTNVKPSGAYPAPLCTASELVSPTSFLVDWPLDADPEEGLLFRFMRPDMRGGYDYFSDAVDVNTTMRACVRYLDDKADACSAITNTTTYTGFCCDFPVVRGARNYLCGTDLENFPRQASTRTQDLFDRGFRNQRVYGNFSRVGHTIFSAAPEAMDFALWITKADIPFLKMHFSLKPSEFNMGIKTRFQKASTGSFLPISTALPVPV